MGNAQRVCDGVAAGYFKAAGSDKVPIVAKPLCVAAGCYVKAAAITAGTGKAVMDGATSVVVGFTEGVVNLFK